MKIDVSDTLTIILGFLTLIGAIYRLAQVEAAINARISRVETNILVATDQIKDGLSDALHKLEKKLDIHLVEYEEKKNFIEYRITGLEGIIKHKFDRLASWIKQISETLNKQFGFQIRDDKF